MRHDGFRFVMRSEGVFHPKLYYFETTKSDWACVVGSANFTNGGFYRNQEICVLFDSADNLPSSARQLLVEKLDEYWESGRQVKRAELEAYRKKWKKRPRPGGLGSVDQKKVSHTPSSRTDFLDWDWERYLTAVRKRGERFNTSRLAFLEDVQAEFSSKKAFTLIDDEARKAIGGYINRWKGHEAKAFGSMLPQGDFMNRINNNDPHISKALSYIPLKVEKERLTRTDFLKFVMEYTRAFSVHAGRKRKHGVAPASRLLAMKRPDYFLCLNNKNERKLLAAFEMRPIGAHDYERYWDEIVQRILESRWWQVPPPNRPNAAAIWNARVAFLDSIFWAGE